VKRLAGLLASAVLLGACAGPAYYGQAVSGHMALMQARQPVDAYLADADADDPLAGRLATAREALAFAEGDLGLPAGGSYDRFVVTGRDAVTWNVITTPPYDLKPYRWCFVVAGCVPYRGYFDPADAERFAGRMRAKGRDSAVSPASAYSTLGWFDDPILDTMLDGSDADLAETLFHELAHQALYVKNDSTFNESYATFVARRGVEEWLTRRGQGEAFARWAEREAATAEFLELLVDTRSRLALLYRRETDPERLAAGKRAAFGELKKNYARLVDERWDGRDRFGGWFEPSPNNADLALVATYTGGICAFESLWRDAEGDWQRFHRLAARAADYPPERRARWLETPCPPGPGSGERRVAGAPR
jgi:predicted aminopeptidase